jgi:hypothetical protein
MAPPGHRKLVAQVRSLCDATLATTINTLRPPRTVYLPSQLPTQTRKRANHLPLLSQHLHNDNDNPPRDLPFDP